MKILLLIVLLLVVYLLQPLAQTDNSWMLWENGVGKLRWRMYHLQRDDVLKMKEKWEEIGESLKNISYDYAGTYYQHGYMSGYFLQWSPENGYIFIRYFDVEHPCYFSYGKVKVDGVEVHFNLEYEVKESRCPGDSSTPKIWIPAYGGKYFIPKEQTRDFANFYAGFGEFNGFLRKTIEDGLPFAFKWERDFKPEEEFILPKGYEKFIKKPINAEVISVGKKRVEKRENFYAFTKKVSVIPVEINIGSNHGAYKGLEFVLLNSDDDKYQTLIITKVNAAKSRGDIIQQIDENG